MSYCVEHALVIKPSRCRSVCLRRKVTMCDRPTERAAGGGFDSGGAMWGGRFEEKVTDLVEKFGESVSYDRRLYKEDIRGSCAHASMLAHQGLISDEDFESIVSGLEKIEDQIDSGKFEWLSSREDVHMNIESALIDLVGEPAKKLHTARSRNDQVQTDVRLYVRDSIDTLSTRVLDVQRALFELADKYKDCIIPGYTHLQRAQPVLLSHHLLAYVEMLERDLSRLSDCRARMNYSPLGACAMAGTGLPIDRHMTAAALEFAGPMRNSIDSVADRDFILELLSALSISAMHLSRLAEEWVMWCSEEFGFMSPRDSVSTGSSIMPQKKNPDPAELVRGKCARVYGSLVTVLTLCKGLPLAYNRDLQEDKEPLFDAVDTMDITYAITAEFARNVTFNREKIVESLPRGYLDATTLADYLVKKGVPFRTGHEIVGKAVALGVQRGVQLNQLSLEELKSISKVFDDEVYTYLGVENAVRRFSSYGSTGGQAVEEQMQYWKEKLST